MKTTDHFKNTIEAYLRDRAETDELFAVSFNNPDKTIEQCITYILETVQKSGCCGYTSDEVFAIATHFWDEKDIVVGNPINCRVVINEHVELTAEEKEQARRNAIKRAENDAYERMTKAKRRPNVQTEPSVQKSLFDL